MTFEIPKRISVRKLAGLLGKTYMDIRCDVWAMRGVKNTAGIVDFETAAKVIRQYGHEARKID